VDESALTVYVASCEKLEELGYSGEERSAELEIRLTHFYRTRAVAGMGSACGPGAICCGGGEPTARAQEDLGAPTNALLKQGRGRAAGITAQTGPFRPRHLRLLRISVCPVQCVRARSGNRRAGLAVDLLQGSEDGVWVWKAIPAPGSFRGRRANFGDRDGLIF
jgi:hypothetical protein